MLRGIVDGICSALSGAFGGDIRIYAEQVKQGLDEPCFIVALVHASSVRTVGDRFYRTALFAVRYIPRSDTDAKSECYEVQDALYWALEYITVGEDLLRGVEMSAEFTDGMLVFTVGYNATVYRPGEQQPMEELSIESFAR